MLQNTAVSTTRCLKNDRSWRRTGGETTVTVVVVVVVVAVAAVVVVVVAVAAESAGNRDGYYHYS